LVGLAIAAIIIAIILFVVVGGILSFGIALICIIPLLCIFIPIAWVIGAAITVIMEQANIAIVVDDLGIMDGLKRGWEIARENVSTMLLMWLILTLGLTTIVGLIVALPMILIAGPAIIGIFAGGKAAVTSGFLIILNGILQSYVKSAWTLTYLRLNEAPDASETPDAPLELLPEESEIDTPAE